MLNRMKDLFSCNGKFACADKSAIDVDISSPDYESKMVMEHQRKATKEAKTKSQDQISYLDMSGNTTDISHFTKSTYSINQQQSPIKSNHSLNKNTEKIEDAQINRIHVTHKRYRSSFDSINQDEDTFRNLQKKKQKDSTKDITKDIDNESQRLKTYWVDKIIISDELTTTNPTFILEDLEGSLLFNQVLTFNAAGLDNSLRGRTDGYAFFGTVDSYKQYIINDFILNKENNDYNKRLFMIYYNQQDSKFYFKNLEENRASVYIKLTKRMIEAKSYVQIGEELIKFDIGEDKTLQITTINDNNSMTYLFPKTLKTVTIGRGKNCNITFASNLLSKIQCTLTYDDTTENWLIVDGVGSKKPSTNGTWFLSHNPIMIYDGSHNDINDKEILFIKIGQEIIKIEKTGIALQFSTYVFTVALLNGMSMSHMYSHIKKDNELIRVK